MIASECDCILEDPWTGEPGKHDSHCPLTPIWVSLLDEICDPHLWGSIQPGHGYTAEQANKLYNQRIWWNDPSREKRLTPHGLREDDEFDDNNC